MSLDKTLEQGKIIKNNDVYFEISCIAYSFVIFIFSKLICKLVTLQPASMEFCWVATYSKFKFYKSKYYHSPTL